MKTLTLSVRNIKEILRDPLTIIFPSACLKSRVLRPALQYSGFPL